MEVKERIKRALFPTGSIPLELDLEGRLPEIDAKIDELISLVPIAPKSFQVRNTRASEEVTMQIVKLHRDEGVEKWSDVSKIMARDYGVVLSAGACLQRWKGWKEKENLIQAVDESQAEGETPTIRRSLIVEETANVPLQEVKAEQFETTVQPATIFGDVSEPLKLNEARVLELWEIHRGTHRVAAALSTEMGIEVPWQAVMGILKRHGKIGMKAKQETPARDLSAPAKLSKNDNLSVAEKVKLGIKLTAKEYAEFMSGIKNGIAPDEDEKEPLDKDYAKNIERITSDSEDEGVALE